MNPWNLIGWAIVGGGIAVVLGGIATRIYRAVALRVAALKAYRLSQTTTPSVGQRWYFHQRARVIQRIEADGSVYFRPNALYMNEPAVPPDQWREEVKAGRLVLL